jgi:hypothetical protein
MKSCLQPGAAGLPSQIGDAAFSEACRLDRLQHVAGTLSVVTDKPHIPDEGECECRARVNENETPHVASCKKSYFLRMQLRKGGEGKKAAERWLVFPAAFPLLFPLRSRHATIPLQ